MKKPSWAVLGPVVDVAQVFSELAPGFSEVFGRANGTDVLSTADIVIGPSGIVGTSVDRRRVFVDAIGILGCRRFALCARICDWIFRTQSLDFVLDDLAEFVRSGRSKGGVGWDWAWMDLDAQDQSDRETGEMGPIGESEFFDLACEVAYQFVNKHRIEDVAMEICIDAVYLDRGDLDWNPEYEELPLADRRAEEALAPMYAADALIDAMDRPGVGDGHREAALNLLWSYAAEGGSLDLSPLMPAADAMEEAGDAEGAAALRGLRGRYPSLRSPEP